jgi:hypothetical protein
LVNAGTEFVPCGLATVSVAAAIGTGGASALAFGVSSAWMINNCVKNASSVQRFWREMKGAERGGSSLKMGFTRLGAYFDSNKAELDMFRESIRRILALGLQDRQKCPRASHWKSQIN